MSRQRDTKSRLFPHVALLFFLALLLAGLIVLCFLWRGLEDYEKTTPHSALLPVARALEDEDYDALASLCGVDMSRFFDRSQYTDWVKTKFGAPEGLPVIQESGARGESGETGWEIVNGNDKRLGFFLAPKEGGGYTVRQPEIPVKSYTIYAPPHLTVTADDHPLNDTEQMTAPKEIEAFAMLPEELRPQMVGYRLQGFTREPKLALLDRSADEYQMEQQEDGSLMFTMRPSGESARALDDYAKKVAKQYALFVSTDITFAQLSPLLVPGTEFYKTLRGFRNMWYVEHSPPLFENLTVSKLMEYSPNDYTVEVAFDFHVVSNKNTVQVIPSHYRLAIHGDAAGGLRLVNLELS